MVDMHVAKRDVEKHTSKNTQLMASSKDGFPYPKYTEDTQEEAKHQTPHHFFVGTLRSYKNINKQNKQ